MCLDTVPVCAPFFHFVIKSQRILFHLMNIKRATDAPAPTRILQTTSPTTTTSDTSGNITPDADAIVDLRVDTAVEAKWKACADEGAEVCGANEAVVLELCGDITVDDINPKFEGDVNGLNYARVTLEGIESGAITIPAVTRRRRRVLASGSDQA